MALTGSMLPRRRIGAHSFITRTGLLLALALVSLHAGLARASCAVPANPIEAENCLPGTDPSVWQVDGIGDTSIQGFATGMSVDVGQTVYFKIDTPATAYTIGIFRIGYYGGLGARQVATVTPSAKLPQSQPACLTDTTSRLVDCGNWAVSASWSVPATAVSGLYFALLTRTDTGGQSQIFFVVRDDSSRSSIVFRTSDETWQAYNSYGGWSLYGPSGAFDLTNRAYKVSYNRPLDTLDLEDESSPFYDTAPMIHWLEANGYDVTYISAADLASGGAALLERHKIYMSVGHDEYVSGPERTAIQAARDAGVDLAFFSGNEMFWKTRWESAIDGSNTPYRTLACYKETLGPGSNPAATAAVDPQDPPVWTGTWRDPRGGAPDDAGIPENALTGQLFRVNGPGSDNDNLSIQIPAAEGKLRFWRNTQLANQSPGSVWTLPAGTLGYEWDVEQDNGFRPPGLFDLSTSTYTLTTDYLLDAGGYYGAGTATHHMSLYRAASGALVFGAGTVQWDWGLDADHIGGGFAPDLNMEQATVNLLADMGVQPATLESGLVPASASGDMVPPTSIIASPGAGDVEHVGSTLTISGSASDSGGGVVAGVEVSTDGGQTWHPAIGTTSWTYAWTPSVAGTTSIETRAVDDSGNLESPTDARSVTVASPTCPCSIFTTQQPQVLNANDGTAYELGMKFQSSVHGQITGIRFWKAAGETGTHTGRIWSASGQLLSSVTFTGETSSGWQQQQLPTPLTIDGNTTYVVSVNVNQYYVATTEGLSNSIVNGDVSSVADGQNGVYGSPAQFPTGSYLDSDYFRDIEFTPTPGTPSVEAVSGNGQTGTTGEALSDPLVIKALDANGFPISGAAVTFTVISGGGSVSPATETTDSAGEASAMLTMGANAGIDTVTASVANIGSVNFSATALQDTIFSSQSPASPNVTDGFAYELGMKFESSVPGEITAIRYWKAPSETGTHVGRIWSAAGALLGSVSFSNETPSGWQLQPLASPIAIAPKTVYIVSVNANAYYVATGGGLATSIANGPLSSVADGANGVYGTAIGSLPGSSYQNTDYFRDISFQPSSVVIKTSGDAQSWTSGATLPKPLVVTVLDASGNPLAGETVSFTVTAGGGSVSAASAVTNSSGQASVSLTLGASPGPNAVQAAVSGIGSATFTATAVSGSVLTTQTPALPNVSDGTSYELGMKFQSSVPGQITAIRYWEAPGETGSHVGTIWSAGGAILARVTFSGETGSGWQVQQLGTPLSISANTTYTVSVNVNQYYVATNAGLASSIVNGPLSSIADGANGVFGSPGNDPTGSYQNTNYFRDVQFVPQ